MFNYISTVLGLIAFFVSLWLVISVVSIDWRDSQRLELRADAEQF